MKKSTFRRLLLLCLCLTLVTVSLIGGTLAKFTTTVDGSGTVTVASWNPEITVNSTKLESSTSVTISSSKIYPGCTNISLPVVVKNGSDTVDAEYTLTIEVTNKPTNMSVSYGSTTLNGTAGTGDASTVTTFTTTAAEVKAGASSSSTNIVLAWPYETSNGDAADTTDAGKSVTVKVTATLTQTTGKPANNG